MKRKLSSSPPAQAGFTRPQLFILILAGLLITAWGVIAAVYLYSSGASGAVSNTLPTLPEPSAVSVGTTPTPAFAGTESPVPPEIPISASCVQKNSGIREGKVLRVDRSGLLDIAAGGGILRAVLAGVDLPPGALQAELAAKKIQELVEGQPVILVSDLAAQGTPEIAHFYVFTQEQFVNYELVRQGLATVNRSATEQSCAGYLQMAEQQAHDERAGVWLPTRVPTRTFVPFVTLDPANQAGCDCASRPVCSDFKTHDEAQTCYNACNDYQSKLDSNRDGIACEELP